MGIRLIVASPNFISVSALTDFAFRWAIILSVNSCARVNVVFGRAFGSLIGDLGMIRAWPFEMGLISRTAIESWFSPI